MVSCFFFFFSSIRICVYDYLLQLGLFCVSGMTNSNYTELNQLYEKYKHQGLHFWTFFFSSIRVYVYLMNFYLCILLMLWCGMNEIWIPFQKIIFTVHCFYRLKFAFVSVKRLGDSGFSMQSIWRGGTRIKCSDCWIRLHPIQIRIPHLWQGTRLRNPESCCTYCTVEAWEKLEYFDHNHWLLYPVDS